MPLYFDQVFAPDAHESGSFIIGEGNFDRARERVMLKRGSGRLAFDTVLGMIAASGLFVPSPASVGSADDGSEIAVAILFEDVDASGADDVPPGGVARVLGLCRGAFL